MGDLRLSIDESVQKWSGFVDQISELKKFIESLQRSFDEVVSLPMASTTDHYKSKIDRLKTLIEKLKCNSQDIESLKAGLKDMNEYGNTASDAGDLFRHHNKLLSAIKDKLVEYESQQKEFKAYHVAIESLSQYLQRCRDKIHTMKQRSPNDKNYVEAVTQALDHLLNKEAQGQIMTEQLQQAVDVLVNTKSGGDMEFVKKDSQKVIADFTELFKDIKKQRDQMSLIMNVFRDFKDETERLSDWLQQIDINIKAAKTCLLLNLEDKAKAVEGMSELNNKLVGGQKEIKNYAEMAKKMKNTCLEANVNAQLKEMNSKYQVTCNMALDVLTKMESIYEQHYQYEKNTSNARHWMDNAWNTIRLNANSEGKTKEDLHRQLDAIKRLIKGQETGQLLIHSSIDWGEKTVRNTRSDGREKINQSLKDLQNDWDKLIKKMSTAKVSVETDLLQWSDAQQSVSKLKEWINDRESRLAQVSQQKHVMITRRSTLGITTLSVSERTATLRQTNSILQDIRAFEPMIKTVANTTTETAPVSEITSKYQDLTDKAQKLYDTEKEMVDRHEMFMDAGNEFMSWLRIAKENLAKCSEPTGDKESLAGKISQLKVLESEQGVGEKMLESALQAASSACEIALEDDRIIVEEEVAFLQDEFDQFVEMLHIVKGNLEGGIVRWTDYQEMYKDALDYLNDAQTTVQSYNKLQSDLQQKRKILEDFQVELQKVFDWQKSLDSLNMKGQILLENCADSRVSNAITQLTTKYQALLSLAKEVMRRLERYFQEHHQHNAMFQDCQNFIDLTRKKIKEARDVENSHDDLSEKLEIINEIRSGLDQGQNKLRYVLELKDKVTNNTEIDGAKKIESETDELKKDFEKLISEIMETKSFLNSKFDVLGDMEKSHSVLSEWIEETENKIGDDLSRLYSDLGEKRAVYEKNKRLLQEVETHAPVAQKIKQKMKENQNKDCQEMIEKFDALASRIQSNVKELKKHIQFHEEYKNHFDRAYDWIKKVKLELQQFGDSHGEKDVAVLKDQKLSALIDSLNHGDALVKKVIDMSGPVLETTNDEGKDTIKQDNYQLKYDYDQVRNNSKQCKKNLEKSVVAWSEFEKVYESMNKWISEFSPLVESERNCDDQFDVQDLERRRELLKEANKQKYEMENLNDKCEILMEYSACLRVRDLTVNIQTTYTNLYTSIQGLLSKAEKSVVDDSEFYKAQQEFETWYDRALGTLSDSAVVEGNQATLKERLDTLKGVTARMTEGQHLLNCVSESYSKQDMSAPQEKQDSMKNTIQDLRRKYDDLSIDLTKGISDINAAIQRWTDYTERCSSLRQWIDDILKGQRLGFWKDDDMNLSGELGEMRTQLERCNALEKEIAEKRGELNSLISEGASISTDPNMAHNMEILKRDFQSIESRISAIKKDIEHEISEYSNYYQSMQDTEKWLLQVSFQLMAHNSLYITNKEQTQEQLYQHSKLLENIVNYQQTLDSVRDKGIRQISKYVSQSSDIRTEIEKQQENVQESYDSLLQTALQINSRLEDSLIKFKEYEETLQSILGNINDWEQQIKNVDTVDPSDPESELEKLRALHNRLQLEKARLSSAIQICEAASASISRPGSPLADNDNTQISEEELLVKTKLEDLIDQVQSSVSALGSQVQELNDIQKTKDKMESWIQSQENTVAELFKKPAKFRSDAAQTEINSILNMKSVIVEKHAVLDDLEDKQSSSANYTPDHNLKIALDTLDEHIGMLLDKKNNQFFLMDDYRNAISSVQGWFERVSKSIEGLEVGLGIDAESKLKRIKEIEDDFEANKDQSNIIKNKASSILKEVGDMDRQHIEEQSLSIERRMNELQKRISRKKQIISMTLGSYKDTEKNIEGIDEWLDTNLSYVSESNGNLPSEVTELQDHISNMASINKEADSKILYIDNLENKINTLQADLETEEFNRLGDKIKALKQKRERLLNLCQAEQKKLSSDVQDRVKFDSDYEAIKTWLKSKSAEYQSYAEFDPLKSHGIEKRISKLKKLENEVKDQEENGISRLNRSALSLSKNRQSDDINNLTKEIDDSVKSFKKQLRGRINDLEKCIGPRKAFEADIEKCTNWLNKSETAVSSEIRGSLNIATLEEQLYRIEGVKSEEDAYRQIITRITGFGGTLIPKLSDSDKLTLQSKMDEICDKMNQVVDSSKKKIDEMVNGINQFKDTAVKVQESATKLSEVHSEIRSLNRPIGYRVEDAERSYQSYESILNDLRKFKAQLEELNRSTGANVMELRALLQRQEEYILEVENYMSKIKNLILIRQQYSSLATGLTEFIINYTEIVKEIERSNIHPSEKVKRYDETIAKISDAEAQLALVTDKGNLIASECTAKDRNKVMDQLQSLKNQVHSLKTAIMRKRQEHVESASETNKLAGEIEKILEALRSKEKSIHSRPVLTTSISNVEEKISEHDVLTKEVNSLLDQLKQHCKSPVLASEESLGPLRSSAQATLSTTPNELSDRRNYLEDNKNHRLAYDNIVQRLKTWVEEAESKLRPSDGGIDFLNLEKELAEFKTYFNEETKLRDLLNQLHENAHKIWPSLTQESQDKLSHEEESYNQLVKNTLNSVHSQQSSLEKHLSDWKALSALLEDKDLTFEGLSILDKVTSLPSLKKYISKIKPAMSNIEEKKLKLDSLKEKSNKIMMTADVLSRQFVEERVSAIENTFSSNLNDLKEQKELASALALQWDDFDNKYKGFDSLLNKYHNILTSGDVTFRSLERMREMRTELSKLRDDLHRIDGKFKDVKILSANVNQQLSKLPSSSSSCKSEIEENVVAISKKYYTLMEDVDNKLKMVNEEIHSIEDAEKRSEELGRKLFKLKAEVNKIDIWSKDESSEAKLDEIEKDVNSSFDQAQELNASLRKKYQGFGQSLPADIAEKLSGLEISYENLKSSVEEKQRDFKRALTIRKEFYDDAEAIQFWIQQAETKVNDRSVDPQTLKDRISETWSELADRTNRMETFNKNGNILSEKMKGSPEKELLTSTINNLTEQMAQIRHLIEEKKVLVNEAVDSWFKFFQLYESIIGWSAEKKVLVSEPLKFNNLSQAKNKLQEFCNANKSVKHMTKNLQEMNKELNHINQICHSENLREKLNEADNLKTDTESHLTEKTAMIQELTEEWEQCEKKIKEVQLWMEDSRKSLSSIANKKRSIREQFALREKNSGDITIARTKINMAVEKLKVHFQEDNKSDNEVVTRVAVLNKSLDDFDAEMKEQNAGLASCLSQLEAYQLDISRLRQNILTEEQALRSAMSPSYVVKNKDKALTEQACLREKIRNIQSKLTAFNERIKLINQRATPDSIPLKYDLPLETHF